MNQIRLDRRGGLRQLQFPPSDQRSSLNPMKNKMLLLAAACLGAVVLFGAPSAMAKPTVEVVFDHPEKFTDIKDSFMATDKGQQANLDEIKAFIEQRAERYLVEGEKFTITFTEIDLAGDFEPQRGPSAENIRVIKDIYPPRLDFTYKLTDANNVVLKEGKEKLRDMSFQMRLNPINANDQLPYEKSMLGDWLSATLKKHAKK